MSPEQLQRLSALLDEALDLAEPARRAWLDALQREDAELGATLRDLLAREARGETAELLRRGPAFQAPAAPDFGVGDAVGPYRLLRQIGSGGMGEVWLAEHAGGQLKRPVALKLPVLGLRRSLLVQRFERERDILAGLVHPHIARLYDAGLAADGQPYLALEFVEGVPITEHCEARRLDVPARIALLRQVMDAVQYAHANLVIHRDLKPSNVLVRADGQALLLDFGIAKLLQDDQPSAAETEVTRLGGHAMTLAYAAPEQVSGAPVSIATDVYALGVLLYELVAGRRPFQTETRTALEQAVLAETPPRPSGQRGGAGAGADANANANARLPRGLANDLDTIVFKAMKKAPAERYATVAAMSDDLERLLRGEPVRAQPDRLGYRLQKFLRRRRVPVAAASLALAALLALTATALVQRESARQEAMRARTVQDVLIGLFESNAGPQDRAAGQRTTARELLDRGAARVDEALRDEPEVRFEVLRSLADIYWRIDLQEQAAALERRRVELARERFGARDARLAMVLLDYMETIQESDRRGEIPALLDEAARALVTAGLQDSELRGQAYAIAADYWRHESLPRALQAADEGLAFMRRHHPTSDRMLPAHMHAARMRSFLGEFGTAIEHLEGALDIARGKGELAAGWSLRPAATMADIHIAAHRLGEAETWLRKELELARRVQGENSITTLTARVRLGNLLHELGRTEEASTLHQAVQAGLAAEGQAIDPFMRSYVVGLLGLPLLERGRPDRLLPILRADIDELKRTIPHSALVAARQRLWAQTLAALGRPDDARVALTEARGVWDRYAGERPSRIADATFALASAEVELAAGRPDAALAALDRHPAAGLRAELNHPLWRARALLALDRTDDAATAVEAARNAGSALPEAERPRPWQAELLLLDGRIRLARGDADAATPLLRQALELRRGHDDEGSLWVADVRDILAIALQRQGQATQARHLRHEAAQARTSVAASAAATATAGSSR
jgi:serine/threonine-protein kinase